MTATYVFENTTANVVRHTKPTFKYFHDTKIEFELNMDKHSQLTLKQVHDRWLMLEGKYKGEKQEHITQWEEWED